MITIDFNKPFLNFDGSDSGQILSETLPNALSQKSGNIKPRIAMGYAKAIKEGNPLVFYEDGSFNDLYNYIENHPQLSNIYICQLLDVMDEAKIRENNEPQLKVQS